MSPAAPCCPASVLHPHTLTLTHSLFIRARVRTAAKKEITTVCNLTDCFCEDDVKKSVYCRPAPSLRTFGLLFLFDVDAVIQVCAEENKTSGL